MSNYVLANPEQEEEDRLLQAFAALAAADDPGCAEAQALPGYCAARGLPGKYAPEAAAAIIRSAIFRNLNLEEAT